MAHQTKKQREETTKTRAQRATMKQLRKIVRRSKKQEIKDELEHFHKALGELAKLCTDMQDAVLELAKKVG